MTLLLQALLPFFGLAGAGYLLGRLRHSDPAPLTDLCLYVLMPLLLFVSLVRNPLSGGEAALILGWFALLVALASGLVLVVGRLAGWDRANRSSVLLSTTNLNVGSFGVPVVLFALGDQALSQVMLLFVYSNIAAGSIGVYIAAAGRQTLLQALTSVFRLPLIYAVGLALLVHGLDLSLPPALLASGEAIGKAGPLVSVVVLGIQLANIPLRGQFTATLAGCLTLRCLAVPALGIGLALGLGAEGHLLHLLLLGACLPSAINTLLLAVRFDTRPELLGGILLGSTLSSPIAIAAVLAWMES